MSWLVGNLRNGYRDELFEKQLQEYYDSVRITKYQAQSIDPDYDESNGFDSDYLGMGLLPVIEGELNTDTDRLVFTSKRGKVKSKKIRIPITKKLREFVYERAEYRCEHCDNEIVQQVHHKDGDPANNEHSNLMAVCYNCHKTLHQYIGRGMISKR
jgi:hypothetical protein